METEMKQETKKILDRNEDKFHSLYGKSLSQKKNRAMKYVRDIPSAQLFKQIAGPQFLGMTLGGTVGGMVGLIGGPKGAAVGVGSGAGVGFIVGTAYAGYKTRKEYRLWIRQHRSDELFTEFLELFKNHPSLEEFRCAYTKKLMHYPFVDPWGFSYEKSAIERWVKEKKTSPVTKRPLSLADIRPNYSLMGKQAKIYRSLLSSATAEIFLSPIQQHGIEALLRDLEVQIDHCFYAENKILLGLLKEKKISRRTYASELNLLADLLDK